MDPAIHTPRIIPVFDFSEALSLTVAERLDRCLARARDIAAGYQPFVDHPYVPERGATEAELTALESSLGRLLPSEYREFLRRCRYLNLSDGLQIGGLDYDGVQVADSPWISVSHRKDTEYLIFASYWRYADGDQLMFDLSDAEHPVAAWLHEHGPLVRLRSVLFTGAVAARP